MADTITNTWMVLNKKYKYNRDMEHGNHTDQIKKKL